MQNLKIKTLISLCTILVPIAIYFYYLFTYSQNIPHWDDYAIIRFVDNINSDIPFSHKIHYFFSQHNEHRIVVTRIVACITNLLSGSLNFRWMMYFGSLALIAIFYLFYKVLKANQLPFYYIIPVAFILFQLSNFENTFWGMASVQNFWVVFFVLISFWQIANNKVPYLWMILAVFTSANAILFLPIIGILSFWYLKSYRNLLKYSVLSIILLLMYFVIYHKPPDSQPIDLSNILLNIKATFVNAGSYFDLNTLSNLDKRVKISFFCGIISSVLLIGIIVLMFRKNIEIKNENKRNLVFFSAIILFVLATCAVTTLSRIHYGFYVFLVSRYKIYSLILVCSLYISLLTYFKYFGKQLIFIVFMILSPIVFLFTFYYSYANIVNYKKQEMANFYNGWHKGNSSFATNIKSSFNYIPTIIDSIALNEPINNTILGKVQILKETIEITNTDFETQFIKPNDGVYLEFLTSDKKYIFSTNHESNRSKKSFFLKGGQYFGKGFNTSIPLIELPTGDYFINILKVSDNKLNKIKCNFYIEIEGIKPKAVIQNW